jgi:hypothetical protein
LRVVKSAGIGLPAKSRAPALVAGWAPRISQTPGFGARLSSSEREKQSTHSAIDPPQFSLCQVSACERFNGANFLTFSNLHSLVPGKISMQDSCKV